VWSDIVHHGTSIQEAVDRPRWLSFPASDPATIEAPYELRMEAGFAPETDEGLRRLGHRVVAPRTSDGGVQVIAQEGGQRVYGGASDPRADGCAIGC
jgi:gamma-glutamyltranspeptidase